jgi:hypothetical protein
MTSWASIAKKPVSIVSLSEKDNLKQNPDLNAPSTHTNDLIQIKNKHISSISEIYNGLLDKLNNGYFTILSIDTHHKRDQFMHMLLNNLNIDYHLKYDNFNSDSDIPELSISDDEEFLPTYSKFAYQ